ncbi:phosphoglycerate dehydrogenase [Algoriphagus sp. SE2]|uniref:phosphoglycerate dehydrogenase n=1 Tax=Algoriphagus sp. SE2 TaxID=3141536 RepID=UPI0031CD2743
MNKILTSPSSIGQISSAPFDLLNEHGYEYINNPYGRKLTEDEVIDLAKDCIGIVAGVEPLTPYVMDNLPNLKCISRVGVGLDSVDLEYAKKKGIVVTYTPDGPTRAVAELTLGMTLSLLRRIPQAHRDMRNHKWGKQIGNLLFGKRIGVLGLGRIGRLVSELFRGLGNPVMGFDPYADSSWAKENNVDLVDFDELIKSCDILTIHVPPSDSPIIGKTELALMKKGSFLINISRGGIVDEGAMLEALVSNSLAGAAIDVFDQEPYSGPLCDLDNVVLTPHLGSYAKEGKLKMEVDAVQNLIDVLKNV